MTVIELKSVDRWIELEALYQPTVTIFRIWVPPGSEAPNFLGKFDRYFF